MYLSNLCGTCLYIQVVANAIYKNIFSKGINACKQTNIQ